MHTLEHTFPLVRSASLRLEWRKDLQIFKDVARHGNQLRIQTRVFQADHFKIKLMELAVAPFLRPVVAETLSNGVELHGLRQKLHAVLDVRAADAGREFRTKSIRSLFSFAIPFACHREEFLLDNVRVLADAAFKDSFIFEHRRINAFVTRLASAVAHGFLDVRHVLMILGEDIVGTLWCSEHQFGHNGMLVTISAERYRRSILLQQTSISVLSYREAGSCVPFGVRNVGSDMMLFSKVMAEEIPRSPAHAGRSGIGGCGIAVRA